MSKNNKDSGRDLSVEEILSSIRNVINNQAAKPGSSEQDAKEYTRDMENEEEILELTEEYLDRDYDKSSDEEDLISDDVISEVYDMIEGLASKRPQKDITGSSSSDDAIIVRFVAKLLRPELRRWLNANLPSIVEDLVQKEIGKLGSRGR